jgi:pheromone alpha factor receptor
MLQNFTLYMPDGTAVLANIPSADTFIRRNGQVCVVYGAQLGASVLMLFVILITTRETKRRSPIFILNVLSLLLSFLRSLLQILYWLGPWNEIYRYLAYDYSTVPRSAYDNSAAAVVLTLLLLITIEASFVLQTNIVCLNTPPLLRWGVVVFSIIITLLTVSVRFVFCVRNIQGILKASYLPDTMMLGQASLITETVSIWFFCLIFVTKLAWALYQRRKMGLKQWGPMQIICIMGGCTMIIPCKFQSLVLISSILQDHILTFIPSHLRHPGLLPGRNLPRGWHPGHLPRRHHAASILHLGRRRHRLREPCSVPFGRELWKRQQPQRSQPQRSQPQRSQPQRSQPQRSQLAQRQ